MFFNLQIQSCNINNPSKMIASLILWVKNYKQHNDIYKWIMTDNDLTDEIIDHWDQGRALHKLVTTTFTLFYQNIYEHNIIHSGLTNRILFYIFIFNFLANEGEKSIFTIKADALYTIEGVNAFISTYTNKQTLGW